MFTPLPDVTYITPWVWRDRHERVDCTFVNNVFSIIYRLILSFLDKNPNEFFDNGGGFRNDGGHVKFPT